MSNLGALDMALDDVISQNRKQRGNNNRGTSNRRGGNSSRGSINKNRSGGGRSSVPYNRPTRNNAPIKTNKPTSGSNSLVVSNLHFNVTEKDLYDLFGQIGPLKRAFLHIGPNGKSAGIADVVFSNSNDAEKARNTYNNVELDGRPMRITSASITSAIASVSNNNNNNRRSSNIRGGDNNRGGNRGGNNNNRGGNRRQGQRRESRPKPNEKDLDADMDTYMGSAE